MITDGLSPLTVLLFLGAVLGRITLRLLAGGIATYVLLLIIASATSPSRALAPGEAKHICEVDCTSLSGLDRGAAAALDPRRIVHD